MTGSNLPRSMQDVVRNIETTLQVSAAEVDALAERIIPKSSDGFTAGRYVVADTDAVGARDPIMLTQQVKFMRDGMTKALDGRGPGLILLVVDDDERDAAVKRVVAALMADEPAPSTIWGPGGAAWLTR